MHSLSVVLARNRKFLNTDRDFNLSVESIDVDSRTSCETPPHRIRTDFREAQMTIILQRAPSATSYKKTNSSFTQLTINYAI